MSLHCSFSLIRGREMVNHYLAYVPSSYCIKSCEKYLCCCVNTEILTMVVGIKWALSKTNKQEKKPMT